MEPQLIEMIDYYLLDQLTAPEKIVFEKQLAGNPLLQQEVMLQHDIMRGIERIALKKQIQQVAAKSVKGKYITKWGFTGGIIAVIISVLVYYNNSLHRAGKKNFPGNQKKPGAGTRITTQQPVAHSIPEDSLPSADQVIDKYLSALGGKEAYEKITSRVMKGAYALPGKGYSTTVEMYFKAPGKFKLVFTGKENTAARGFDGLNGWSKNYAEEGLRILRGTELTTDSMEAIFYREIHLKDIYPQMTVKGKDTTDGHNAWMVEALTAGGSREMMYFDIETGLLLRRDVKMFLSIRNAAIHFRDYKEVNGIKFPFIIHIVRATAPFITIYSFDKAIVNEDIPDEVFAIPAK